MRQCEIVHKNKLLEMLSAKGLDENGRRVSE